MDTGLVLIIAIVILVLLTGALLLGPARRGRTSDDQAQAELEARRLEAVEDEQRAAEQRRWEAERLEQEADARRDEADFHEEHASQLERGLADEELVGEEEEDLARAAGLENRTDPGTELPPEVGYDDARDPVGHDVPAEESERAPAPRRGDRGRGQEAGARVIKGGRAHEPAPREVPGGRAHEPAPREVPGGRAHEPAPREVPGGRAHEPPPESR